MDLLIAETLEPEVITWLETRHSLRYAPQLAQDPRGFRQGLYDVRGLIVPAALAVDANLLQHAPRLRAVGRVSAGAENIDLEACTEAGVEVVRCLTASAPAEAEFMLQALLSLLRRFPVVGPGGQLAGRELSACTVGLVGMAPAARSMAQMLAGFETRLVGYDPALHTSDSVWERWRVEPLGLRELLQEADAVCVQLPYFSRYRGLLGERFLPFCRPDQVIVSISHSALFDENWLADALATDRIAAVWLDSVEPGLLDPGRPLHGIETLQVSPRVASTTRESHLRSAWAVAKRIDELLRPDLQAQAG
ncbi:MAG: phosphoglycerate dehydrogenase [Ideonella sp.]|nr:phosphoglycerate dehydrogenase [Ideonella sp.]